MNRKMKLIMLSVCLITFTSVFGQVELNDALSRGDVTLTTRGAGRSTGVGAVSGNLRNNTAQEIQINVIIRDGLYLVNSGRGQNMIALQIFERGGRFRTLEGRRFIALPANSNTAVDFNALCAEFDMANPTSAETFRVAAMPQSVRTIFSRISRYLASNFDANPTTAAQIALWRTHDLSRGRGLTRQEIATTFPVSDADWAASTRIMNYGVATQPRTTQPTTNQTPQPVAVSNNAQGGVLINGVRWATHNVGSPRQFVTRPEEVGMLFQWNRQQGWSSTSRNVSGWNSSREAGTEWTANNNPCPQGWRVPTETEFLRLIDAGSVWTRRNGVNGRLFGTAPNQIFLPITANRPGLTGSLSLFPSGGGYFWSSSTQSGGNARGLFLDDSGASMGNYTRNYGFSIRCVAE